MMTLAASLATAASARGCYTTTGDPCAFPFAWEGEWYETCTTHGDGEGRRWCATAVDEGGRLLPGQWGHCAGCDGASRPADPHHRALIRCGADAAQPSVHPPPPVELSPCQEDFIFFDGGCYAECDLTAGYRTVAVNPRPPLLLWGFLPPPECTLAGGFGGGGALRPGRR